MIVAYLVNQYPKVSHSFIRREIAGIEACGVSVERFSIRSCEAELVDPADKSELQKTKIVLAVGILGLLRRLTSVAVTRPILWFKALRMTLKLGWRSEKGVLYHFAYLAEACVLLRWFQESKISHIHAHFGTNPTAVALLCSILSEIPYSFTVHGPEEFDKPGAIGLSEKINHAAFVVTISSFSKSQLYRLCDYKQWSKIHIVRCGVDSSFFSHSRDLIPNCQQLVCVARLSEQKGQLLLIDAVSQLVAEGLDLKLLLVGDGPLRTQIESLIAHYGLEEQVEITGWASGAEVRQHIINSKALVLPSFAEGLPVVIMEALALCRPVISTYIAGIPELVEPGINGWLVPSGSVETLKASMREALQMSADQIEQMGEAGAKRVVEQHDVTVEAVKLAQLFQSQVTKVNKD
jgi:colanic acid/amylovoran biosynthesis glycosyltransferase